MTKLDLASEQIDAIAVWASATPEIAEVYIFGSRSKGTSRPTSDVDVAIVIASQRGLTDKEIFKPHEVEWTVDLEELICLGVDLCRLHPTETPKTASGVSEAGVLVFSRT